MCIKIANVRNNDVQILFCQRIREGIDQRRISWKRRGQLQICTIVLFFHDKIDRIRADSAVAFVGHNKEGFAIILIGVDTVRHA